MIGSSPRQLVMNHLPLVIFLLILSACRSQDTPAPKPVAFFDYPNPVPTLGQPYLFINKSTDANRFKWRWGDGTPDGTTKNASHIYQRVDRFKTKLIATGDGGVDSIDHEFSVQAPYNKIVGRYHGKLIASQGPLSATTQTVRDTIIEIAWPNPAGSTVFILGHSGGGVIYNQNWRGHMPNRANYSFSVQGGYNNFDSILQAEQMGDSIYFYYQSLSRSWVITQNFYGVKLH